MVNAGLFGEIIYMRGGYRHDLRALLLDDAGNIGHRGKRRVFGEVSFISVKMEIFILHMGWRLCV